MKWSFLAITGLAIAWSAVSCTADRSHAQILGGEGMEPMPAYYSGYVPAAFRELRWNATNGMPAATRQDYILFCNRPHYPNISESWINSSALHASGPCEVHINLASQRGLCLVNSKVAMDFPVCTGSSERPTPIGSFQVLEKDRNHRSNLYNNAPMFCFMRLTWDGVGMHIGELEGVPASHGCIRLPGEACRKLFSRLPEGAPVIITP